MKNYDRSDLSSGKGLRARVYLLVVAITLGLGLAFASSAHGATPAQTGGGKITGSATVGSSSTPDISVELRQRTNAGADTLLTTTTTDSKGNYLFSNQPSAPGDAFYYIRFTGGKGTLASWYTWPIIYLTGSDFSVPPVDLSDVLLVEPALDGSIGGGGAIKWKARRAGETYRLFVYSAGKTDKPVVDSGSLGSNTEYSLSDGSLPEGKYEAVVQIRDAVVGYGQSQAHFRFTVAKTKPADPAVQQPQSGASAPGAAPTAVAPAPVLAPTSQPSEAGGADTNQSPTQQPPTQQPTVPPAPGQPSGSNVEANKPDLKLHLSADKLLVDQGKSLVYTIEVRNDGDGTASNIVVTDQLPAGVSVDSSQTKSSLGAVAVAGNIVTVQVGDLAPNTTAKVEIPVSVNGTAANNVSNQASAVYKEAPEAVQSNAFVSQVAEPLAGASQPQQPAPSQPQAPADSQPQQPASQPPAAPQDSQQGSAQSPQPKSPPKAPPASNPSGQTQQPPASQPKSPAKTEPHAPATKPAQQPTARSQAASMPQTGGSFPIVFAVLLLVMALVARYLRGIRFRRS